MTWEIARSRREVGGSPLNNSWHISGRQTQSIFSVSFQDGCKCAHYEALIVKRSASVLEVFQCIAKVEELENLKLKMMHLEKILFALANMM